MSNKSTISFLSLLLLLLTASACGSEPVSGSPDDDEAGYSGEDRSKLHVDAGPPRADAGGNAGDAGDAGDASVPADAAAPADASPGTDASADASVPPVTQFEGVWNVDLLARPSTCRVGTFEPHIVDVWTFHGASLSGEHINGPYTRASGSNTWSITGLAEIRLELDTGVFFGTRTLHMIAASCDVIYDVESIP